ncbi:uncharacterized protein UTRI_10670 [Ustilago trichophora]|uniref:Uncharacterized protein n=1 Tax=Ustilago trichophora TaxID=86804 RepID=A0A5C3EBC7_9BASI|nr:uncharacterized protein UTRI_10670 [Ustilago trichophora]
MLIESKVIDLVTYGEAKEWYQGPTIDLKPSQFPNSPDLSRNAWDHANKQDQGFIHVGTEKPSWLKKVFFRAKPQVYLSSKVRPTDGIAKKLELTKKQAASLLWKYNPKTQEKKLIHISKYTYNDKVVWPKRPLQDALKPLDKVAEPLQEIVGHVH